MQITQGVHMLEITATTVGRVQTIYPTLLYDDVKAVLVDTAFPGQLPLLRAAMAAAGCPFERLTKVILTHQDIDHIGGLPAIEAAAPHSLVLASAEEKPYIQGERRLIKLSPEAVARAVNSLPPEVPEATRQAFRATLENPPHAPVGGVLVDGQELPDAGGITVIKTPGHTPGHLCLYHRPSKTLIAGDELRVVNGELEGPAPQLSHDMTEALRSLGKLTGYDIAAVVCYHGGLFQGDVNARLVELTRT
jgi:glyoxylase-like metal-dependent hydrolase (beta-lactamase superfamily II)